MALAPDELERLVNATCATTLERFTELDEEDLHRLRQMVEGSVAVGWGARQNALTLLGRAGDQDAVPLIINRLADFDERERINAVDALGRLATPNAVASVIELVDDPSPDVRRFAISTLGRTGGDVVRERLIRAAEEESVDFVRLKAEQVLHDLKQR